MNSYKPPNKNHMIIANVNLCWLSEIDLSNYFSEVAFDANTISSDFIIKEPPFRHFYSGVIKLTPRELDCIKSMVQGFTVKMIAQQLNLSSRTVESYVEKLKQKFLCQTRSELIAKFTQWQSKNMDCN